MQTRFVNYSAQRENPETARIGSNWTDDEDTALMERVVRGMDIHEISKAHQRTVGGIKARIMKHAVFIMETRNMSIEQVSEYVHMPVQSIKKYIAHTKSKTSSESSDQGSSPVQFVKEIIAIKNDIRDLKKSVSDIIDMLRAIYEFEKSE
jgi:hypothetical protein